MINDSKSSDGDGASVPQLQPEIWINIIEQLRQTRPLAGTNFYRSSIRQHDLSIMMRVSRELNKLTAPILYRTIITDDIPQLLKYNDRPGVPGLKSKKQLLELTKRLFIEYLPIHLSPTYAEIMADKEDLTWDEVSVKTRSEEKEMALVIDTERLHKELQVDKQTDLFHLFPKLKTLSLAAHFDNYAPIWRNIFLTASAPFIQRARKLSRLIQNTVLSGKIDHHCQSDIHGPISIAPTGDLLSRDDGTHEFDGLLYAGSKTKSSETNLLSVHLTSWEDGYCPPLLPTILGRKTLWCFDDDIITPIEHIGQITRETIQRELMLGRPIDILAIHSLTLVVDIRRSAIFPPTNATSGHGIDIDMYFPLASPLAREHVLKWGDVSRESYSSSKDAIKAAEEQAYWHKKEKIKELSVPTQRRGLDLSLEGEDVSMKPTFDYPGCPACGWAPRRVREGTF